MFIMAKENAFIVNKIKYLKTFMHSLGENGKGILMGIQLIHIHQEDGH